MDIQRLLTRTRCIIVGFFNRCQLVASFAGKNPLWVAIKVGAITCSRALRTRLFPVVTVKRYGFLARTLLFGFDFCRSAAGLGINAIVLFGCQK